MSDQNVIATYKTHMPQDANEVRDRVKEIQSILEQIMIKDIHYGVIPGTGKPTLFKPGSEVLLTAFRISVQPDIVDLSSADEIRYRVIAKGVHMASQTLIGCGVGEASTNEEKYKWRAAVTPEEFDAAPEMRRRIKYGFKWGQEHGVKLPDNVNQVRTNPSDLANTVLKMAKKRAQVDLCLTALAASDIFNQDIEDVPAGAVNTSQPAAHPKSQSTEPVRSSGGGSGMATIKQIGLLKARLGAANIQDADFLATFEIPDFEHLPFAKVNDALAWISGQ